VSERVASTELSLPMFPELTDDEVATVIAAVCEECRRLA
jgi:dTDP-4-amino-4,6-dideoxygalactose transaminase